MKSMLRRVLSFFFYLCARSNRLSHGTGLKINGFSRFSGNVQLGNNVHINGCRVYGQGGVTVGSNCHFAKGLVILTQNHNYLGRKLPYDESIIPKPVVIHDNVWIGLNVMVLPGVTIGEGAIIQAGSVVSRSIAPLSIAGGNPAKAIKSRDQNHYKMLVRDEAFH